MFTKSKVLCLLLAVVCVFLNCTACSQSIIDNLGREVGDVVKSVSDSENEYVKMVKGGHNVNYPDVTYEDAFSAFFGKPRWQYFKSDDDQNVVEFTGDCTYQDVQVKARIQFVVNEDEGTFEAAYLSFNEVPQNMLVLTSLIDSALGGVSTDQTNMIEDAAYLTVSIDGVLHTAAYPITVTGDMTVQQLLIEAHNELYPGGAAAGFSDGIDTMWNMYLINKCWGILTTPYVIVNGGPLQTTADVTPISPGDNVIVSASSNPNVSARSISMTVETENYNAVVTAQEWVLNFTTFVYDSSPLVGVEVINPATGELLGKTDNMGQITLPASGVGAAAITGLSAVPVDIAAIDKQTAASPAFVDDRIPYTHPTLGFTLLFPKGWSALCVIDEREDGVSFFNLSNYEQYGGFLFGVYVGTYDDLAFEIDMGADILWEDNNTLAICCYPSDIQFDWNSTALQKEYTEMADEIPGIIASFRR